MSKRAAEDSSDGGVKLRDGERPQNSDDVGGSLDFADEFEDEYDSEDEIFEAGVDGGPDDERDGQEKRGMWTTPEPQCGLLPLFVLPIILMEDRFNGRGQADIHTWTG